MANLTEYPAPRSHKNPEPPPTCPFINQQCQRADNHTGQLSYPVPCVLGDQRPYLLATVQFSASVASSRPVNGHLGGPGDSGNPKNDSFWKFPEKSRMVTDNPLILLYLIMPQMRMSLVDAWWMRATAKLVSALCWSTKSLLQAGRHRV
ncbi:MULTISPECIES: hypothetical protein [Sphingobium]|nr:hypothetical protein [Sphingobium sp. YC-XJ3]RYL97100.1 hypothetical protein EWH10_14650 [Sphingobium fuliginis]WDA35502.1 hypothetical protein PO876_18905 [Sphingobium sp. YC-XJ3]